MALDFQPITNEKKSGVSFKPNFDTAQASLAMSESMKSSIFKSPLQNIAEGQGDINVERVKGFGKGLLSTVSGAGLQNAGPVGADIMQSALQRGRGAGKFAQAIQAGEEFAQPTNPQQELGFTGERVAEFITPVGAGQKVSAAAPGIIQKVGQTLKGAGKELYKFLIPRSAKEAQLLQSYKARTPITERLSVAMKGEPTKGPKTAAETSFEYGLKGTESSIGVGAKKAQQTIWKDVVSPALKESDVEVDMDQFFNTLADDIARETPELNRQADLLEGLDALREAYRGKKTSMEDLQKFKEGWAEFVPEKFYKGKNIAGAFGEVKALAADKARQSLYDTLGDDVKEAYLDYGNLQGIVELGQKAMTGGRLKGGFGGFWSAIKDMTLTPVATVGGRVLYRTGEGIEFVGDAGAKTLSDLEIARGLKTLLDDSEESQAE